MRAGDRALRKRRGWTRQPDAGGNATPACRASPAPRTAGKSMHMQIRARWQPAMTMHGVSPPLLQGRSCQKCSPLWPPLGGGVGCAASDISISSQRSNPRWRLQRLRAGVYPRGGRKQRCRRGCMQPIAAQEQKRNNYTPMLGGAIISCVWTHVALLPLQIILSWVSSARREIPHKAFNVQERHNRCYLRINPGVSQQGITSSLYGRP